MSRGRLIQKLFAVQDGKCFYCGVGMTLEWNSECPADNSATIDHVVAQFFGGTNHRANLVGACNKCNNAKKNWTLHEFKGLAEAGQTHIKEWKAPESPYPDVDVMNKSTFVSLYRFLKRRLDTGATMEEDRDEAQSKVDYMENLYPDWAVMPEPKPVDFSNVQAKSGVITFEWDTVDGPFPGDLSEVDELILILEAKLLENPPGTETRRLNRQMNLLRFLRKSYARSENELQSDEQMRIKMVEAAKAREDRMAAEALRRHDQKLKQLGAMHRVLKKLLSRDQLQAFMDEVAKDLAWEESDQSEEAIVDTTSISESIISERVIAKERAKTERHRINTLKNLTLQKFLGNVFKDLAKEMLPNDEYMRLVTTCIERHPEFQRESGDWHIAPEVAEAYAALEASCS